MGHRLWESASPHAGCLAPQFPSSIDKNKLSWEVLPKKTPQAPGSGCLKIDVLRAASETFIFAFLASDSGGENTFLV